MSRIKEETMLASRATDNYYAEERKIYKYAYNIYLRNSEVPFILKKLCRHYKVRVPRVRYWGHRDSGSAGWDGLRLSNLPSIGLLIHEFGHYAKDKGDIEKILRGCVNKGTSHHGTLFQATLNQVHSWAMSNNYWNEQLQNRRERKDNKISQEIRENKEALRMENILGTKIEKTKKKIYKKEESIKKYNKRLEYYQKLYATKTKNARRSIGSLKGALTKYEKELDIH